MDTERKGIARVERGGLQDITVARRVAIHAALADPHRLSIVDELAWSDRSPSELSDKLEIGTNLLAHHLQVLDDAGLIARSASAGDRRRRYLTLRAEGLTAIAEPVATLVARNILFVCTANSARSQLAAAIWNARHEVPASSAGTRPATAVHAQALAAATRAGLDLTGARPRALGEVVERADLVVSVCDIAHEELRSLPDDARLLHWSIPDPVKDGSPSAFDHAVDLITSRVETLAPHVRPPRRPRRERP